MMVWWRENSSPDFLLTADEFGKSNLTFLGGFGITLGFGVGLKKDFTYPLFLLHI